MNNNTNQKRPELEREQEHEQHSNHSISSKLQHRSDMSSDDTTSKSTNDENGYGHSYCMNPSGHSITSGGLGYVCQDLTSTLNPKLLTLNPKPTSNLGRRKLLKQKHESQTETCSVVHKSKKPRIAKSCKPKTVNNKTLPPKNLQVLQP